jgi:hypothetical protein
MLMGATAVMLMTSDEDLVGSVIEVAVRVTLSGAETDGAV